MKNYNQKTKFTKGSIKNQQITGGARKEELLPSKPQTVLRKYKLYGVSTVWLK